MGNRYIFSIMHILYYVTAHGFGHAIRASAICNQLSSHISLTIRSTIPKFLFEEEFTRPFFYAPEQFDCGCIQSDPITVDIKKSLQTYMTLADANTQKLVKEIVFCKEKGITGIVSDIVPFAFEVAKAANIPSIAISNFSWVDIYKQYIRHNPEFSPYLDKIDQQYTMADLLLALSPHNAMSSFKKKKQISLIGRQGVNRSLEIKAAFDVRNDKRIALIYLGEKGHQTIPWDRLEQFKQWEFFGLYPLSQRVANYHVVDKKNIPYLDMIASADLVVSKIGYGVLSECLSNGTPLLYVPRKDFAEHPILEQAILHWGGGYAVEPEDYFNLQWQQVLQQVIQNDPLEKMSSHGEIDCAKAIEQFFSGTS